MTPTPIHFHRRARARSAAGISAVLPVSAAMAHPGHDATPTLGFFEGLVHLLTQPDHLAMLAIAVAIGVAGARAWRAHRASRHMSGRKSGRHASPQRR